MRYVLTSEASSAIDPSHGLCLPLGEAKLESLWIGEPEAQQSEVRRAIFHGWAHLERPRPYVAALAAQFPNVRSVVEDGYGISGRIQGREGYAMEVQTYVPEFKPKS
jgi:hypothetical protein